jgi:hypothetical protein
MPILSGHNGLSITRRKFLRSGALTAAVVPAASSWGLAAASANTPAQHVGQHAFEPNPSFLESAKGTAQWIESAQKQDARGAYWLQSNAHTEEGRPPRNLQPPSASIARVPAAQSACIELRAPGQVRAVSTPDSKARRVWPSVDEIAFLY